MAVSALTPSSEEFKVSFPIKDFNAYWTYEVRKVIGSDLIRAKLNKEFKACNLTKTTVYPSIKIDTSPTYHVIKSNKEEFVIGNRKYTVAGGFTQGHRKAMEDFCVVERMDVKGLSQALTVGVFDGHGGHQVAEYATKELLIFFKKQIEEECQDGYSSEGLWNAQKIAFARFNRKMIETFKKEKFEKPAPGSTATMVTLVHDEIWTSNLGDSGALFYDGKSQEAFTIGRKQKPNHPEFKKSIEKRGGEILKTNLGNDYVNGILGPARAFGNEYFFHMRPGHVSPLTARPKITCIPQKPGIILLASDGYLDHLDSNFTASALHQLYLSGEDPEKFAKLFVEQALDKNSKDNVTVLLIKIEDLTS